MIELKNILLGFRHWKVYSFKHNSKYIHKVMGYFLCIDSSNAMKGVAFITKSTSINNGHQYNIYNKI